MNSANNTATKTTARAARAKALSLGYSPESKLLVQALDKVSSASIRAWVVSEANISSWRKIAKLHLGKEDAATRLAIDIQATAIGLW